MQVGSNQKDEDQLLQSRLNLETEEFNCPVSPAFKNTHNLRVKLIHFSGIAMIIRVEFNFVEL